MSNVAVNTCYRLGECNFWFLLCLRPAGSRLCANIEYFQELPHCFKWWCCGFWCLCILQSSGCCPSFYVGHDFLLWELLLCSVFLNTSRYVLFVILICSSLIVSCWHPLRCVSFIKVAFVFWRNVRILSPFCFSTHAGLSNTASRNVFHSVGGASWHLLWRQWFRLLVSPAAFPSSRTRSWIQSGAARNWTRAWCQMLALQAAL